jgi:NTE family protein
MDISLALGGGGSRGYAHIGVLRRLEQEGYRICAVAGTSAGGIMAALYAAGFTPDEIETALTKVDQSKLFGRSAKEGPGLIGLSGAEELLTEFLGNRTFADLRIPCAMVAVDIISGREIILDQGRVVDAVLATIALPGIFPPRLMGEYQLVDGGVLDPVPGSVARSLAPRLPMVAVVLNPVIIVGSEFIQLPVQIPVITPIVERLTRTRVAQAFNLFLQAVDISSRRMADMRLDEDDPDVVIRPEVNNIGLLDKVDIHVVAKLGEQAADAVLPRLKRATAWPNRLRCTLFPHRLLIRRRGK